MKNNLILKPKYKCLKDFVQSYIGHVMKRKELSVNLDV